MICKKTGLHCSAPSMCMPFGGCPNPSDDAIRALEQRVAKLEKIVEHLCPDKSDDV